VGRFGGSGDDAMSLCALSEDPGNADGRLEPLRTYSGRLPLMPVLASAAAHSNAERYPKSQNAARSRFSGAEGDRTLNLSIANAKPNRDLSTFLHDLYIRYPGIIRSTGFPVFFRVFVGIAELSLQLQS
jgi:hypothetical protein